MALCFFFLSLLEPKTVGRWLFGDLGPKTSRSRTSPAGMEPHDRSRLSGVAPVSQGPPFGPRLSRWLAGTCGRSVTCHFSVAAGKVVGLFIQRLAEDKAALIGLQAVMWWWEGAVPVYAMRDVGIHHTSGWPTRVVGLNSRGVVVYPRTRHVLGERNRMLEPGSCYHVSKGVSSSWLQRVDVA